MSGFPASILAYGTTGSGKTHTLFGPRENPGVGPQCVAALLKMLQDAPRTDDAQPLLSMSCYELYQNQVYDLLVGKHHEVAFGGKDELAKTSDVFSKTAINTIDDFWEVLTRVREACCTKVNPLFAPRLQCWSHAILSGPRCVHCSILPYASSCAITIRHTGARSGNGRSAQGQADSEPHDSDDVRDSSQRRGACGRQHQAAGGRPA